MKLKQTCSCGAVLEIEDENTYAVAAAQEKFIKDHEMCFLRESIYGRGFVA